MENKQLICDKLTELLQLTRYGEDIDRLEYKPADNTYPERVAVYYKDTIYGINVNVDADSGIALIKDVIRRIL